MAATATGPVMPPVETFAVWSCRQCRQDNGTDCEISRHGYPHVGAACGAFDPQPPEPQEPDGQCALTHGQCGID